MESRKSFLDRSRGSAIFPLHMGLDVSVLIRRLKKHYPNAHCALNHNNPFELLIATVLSAQCTDARVNIVTKDLFARFGTPDRLSRAALGEIEDIIRSTGFFRAKAKNLKALAMALVEKYHSKVPEDMDSLTELPGVGRKTANVVLGTAFGIASGVVVDTHVKRLTYRMGLTRNKDPEKIEGDLKKKVPAKHWVQFSHWLISHGREICVARRPRCAQCFLVDICPKKGV